MDKIHNEENIKILNKDRIWLFTSTIHLTLILAVIMGRSGDKVILGSWVQTSWGHSYIIPYLNSDCITYQASASSFVIGSE